MNTKVEEAFKVLDEQHDDYLQAGEYSGEGCWFGNNFAADYAKEYAAARTTLTAHIAQQDATIARLREALEKVSNYSTDKAREFDADFAKLHADHAACPACQEATKRSWPPSGLCNEHYGPFHKLIDRRNDAVESDDKWGRVDIARAALAALNQEQVK